MSTIEVLPQSYMSLYIETLFENEILGNGTAFILEHNEKFFLITNRHIVRGRHQHTDMPLSKKGGIPNKIRIYFNEANKLGSWILGELNLYQKWPDETTFLWHEHPILKHKADIVAFKIDRDKRIDLYPYYLNSDFNIKLYPTTRLNAIGFPFGEKASGYLAIWITGFLATDIDLDYNQLPVFLIDSRTRPGQSGSPVIAYRNGDSYVTNQGNVAIAAGFNSKLLGVYSGRINEESDLGYVWKINALKELVESI